MNKEKILELLAENEHATWSSWMLYLFEKSIKNDDGTVTIPEWAVDGWTRQANTPYNELSEEEKESDRREVRHLIPQILTAPEGKCPECGGVNEAGDNSPCPVCTAQKGVAHPDDNSLGEAIEKIATAQELERKHMLEVCKRFEDMVTKSENHIAKRKIGEWVKTSGEIKPYPYTLKRLLDWLDQQEDK